MRLTRLVVMAVLCLLPSAVRAQDAEVSYDERFRILARAHARDPQSVEALYNLTHFYFDNSHPMRSLPMAMQYARMTEDQHVDLLQRNRISDLAKLQRVGITLASIRELQKAIVDAAVEAVRRRDDFTMAEIDAYLEWFGDNTELARSLRAKRYRITFREMLALGSADDCYGFITTYQGTTEATQVEERLLQLVTPMIEQAEEETTVDTLRQRYPQSTLVRRAVERRKSQLAFTRTEKEGTIAAYNAFLDRYPASDEGELARDRIDHLLTLDLAKRQSAMELAHFADSNADLELSDRALARLRRLIYVNHDVEAAQYYVDHYKLDAHFSEVYSRYYSWHAIEGNAAPLERFAATNPDFPFPRALEDDLERAMEIDTVDLLSPYREENYDRYASHVRYMMGKAIAMVPLQRMIQPLLKARRYDDALFRMEQFEICFDNQWQNQYRDLRHLVADEPAVRALRRELTDSVAVLRPSINPADGKLYYSDGHRICRAVHTATGWRPDDTVALTNATSTSLTLFGFYAQGTRMLLGSGGDIWVAEPDGDQWRVSDIPPYPVNTDYIETDACMLPDGSGLLLASDRPGGFNLQPSGANFHGDTALATDLWFIPYTQHRWGTPVNLGQRLNTIYCERYPVLSRNMQTLYFVSDGHTGLGFGDVYMAERTDPTDWTSWSDPVNLGREVNSGFREGGLSLSPDERRLYLSSDADGRPAAYSFATTHNTASAGRIYSLDVTDLDRSLVRLQVADVDHQTITQVVDYTGDSPSVDLNLYNNRRYALLADAGTSFITATVVNPAELGRYRLPAYTYEQLVAMDRPLPLPVVDFSADGAELLPVAQLQLEQLARFLVQHPQAIAEVVVDVAGTEARHCYTLSLQRAAAVRDFLTAHGLPASRILLSPYGNARAGIGGTSAVAVRFRD